MSIRCKHLEFAVTNPSSVGHTPITGSSLVCTLFAATTDELKRATMEDRMTQADGSIGLDNTCGFLLNQNECPYNVD